MRQVSDVSATIKFKTLFSDTQRIPRSPPAFRPPQQCGCRPAESDRWKCRPESSRPSDYFLAHILLDRVACSSQRTQNQLHIPRRPRRDGGRRSGPHSLPDYGSTIDATSGTDVSPAYRRGHRVGGSPAGSPHRQRRELTAHRSESKDALPFLLASRVANARHPAHQHGRSTGGPPAAAPRRRWCRSARRWQRPLPESRSPWPQRCGTAQPPPPSR